MSRTIELTDEVEETRSFRWTLLLLLIKAGVLIFAASLIVKGTEIVKTKAELFYGNMISAITKTQIVREYVSVQDVPVEELISKFSKQYKIHEVILQAIILKESSGGLETKSYAFEAETFIKRASVDAKYTENERRMRASSHGITQVMGFRTQPDCGVHWSKLYDKAVAVECSSKIMRENLDSVKDIKSPSLRLREAFRKYNGSGPMAEAYADHAMGKVGELLFNQLKGAL